MIDPVLEEEIAELKSLLALWASFSALLARSREEGASASSMEDDFKAARDGIARRYPALMERLEVAHGDRDETVNLLARVPSAREAARLPQIQWKKVEETRSRVDVDLRGLLGILEERKRRLASVNRSRIALRRILSSWVFKLLSIAAGVVLFFLVLNAVV